jgi:hypothetical protein
MPDDFSDFEDLELPLPSRSALPDQAVLLGEDGDDMRAMLVDSDHRLVMDSASLVHYGRLPEKVPNSAAGKLEEHPTSGVRDVIEINVVNVTSSDVTLTLYLHDDTPSSTHVFAANGVTVPADGRFQWQGIVKLETKDIWGLAGTANALYAFFSVRDEVDTIR